MNLNTIQSRKCNQRGFTLIEMLVSISLFAVVITMSVGTLLVLIDANSRAQSMQLVMTNLSFALDSMTREIRTGTDWYCGEYTGNSVPSVSNEGVQRDCAGSANYITITESGESLTGGKNNNRITYWFEDDTDGDGSNRGAVKRCLGNVTDCNSSDDWLSLTGREVDIDDFALEVRGTSRWSSSNDTEQPTLSLYIKGRTGFEYGDDSNSIKEFSLQTSVTQRTLDI